MNKIDFNEALAQQGLTRETYEQCLSDITDKMNGLNDMDWSEIQAKYNLFMSVDTLRKACGTNIFGSYFVAEYLKGTPSTEVENIRKEKQKLSDERAALNKKLRETARSEVNLQHLENMIRENGRTSLPSVRNVYTTGDNDMLICLSDFHLGIDARNYFGAYDSNIAERRLRDYVDKIVALHKQYNSDTAYVCILGDLLSGNIHLTTQLENRENVVEQIQKVSELIAAFVYELSKEFNQVIVNSVAGNHSRIGKKDDVLRGERLDELIPWYVKTKLEHLNHVVFVDKSDNYDDTIGRFDIRGREFLLVHGDYDSFSEAGLSKLSMMIGHFPYAVVFGHLHHCSYDDIANIKLIRSGSFSGSVDDYSISKRLCGDASQMVAIVNNYGLCGLFPMILE